MLDETSQPTTTTVTEERPTNLSVSGTLDFMRLLWAIDHALQSTSKRMEQRFGVTGPQRLVIRIVGQFPRASAGQIARVLQIHPSTLTGILRRLESRQLIERKPDPADGRRALFVLTKTGRDADRLQEGTPEAAVSRALQLLPSTDVEAARRVLSTLAGSLEELLAEPNMRKRLS
jgi:MarR family transcriptional regulator, organic hydroperoxide resistance regulator